MTIPGVPAAAGPGDPRPGAPGGPPGGQSLTDLPDIVVVPAHPVCEGERRDVVLEVREDACSQPVLPVFSSVQRLTEALGGAQPWVAFPLRAVRELAADGRVRTIVLDPEVDPGAWRWRYDDLRNSDGSAD